MKLHFGLMLVLGALFAAHQPVAAQILHGKPDFFDTVKIEAATLETQYKAGTLRAESGLLKYVQALTLLGRYDEAFQVQDTALQTQQLPRTAETVRLAADLLLFQNKNAAATPLLKEALALGDLDAQIRLAEIYVAESQNSDLKNCDFVAMEVTKAIEAGMDLGTGSMFMGFCYFEQAQQKMQPECRTKQRASAYSVMPDSARTDIRTSKAYFSDVPRKSAAADSAKHWLTLYRKGPVLRQFMCGEIEE